MARSPLGYRLLDWLWGLGLGLGLVILGRVGGQRLLALFHGLKQRQAPKKRQEQLWQELRGTARSAAAGDTLPWTQVAGAYERLENQVLEALRPWVPGGARSLPRQELRAILVEEQGISDSDWQRLEKLIEFGETVRFAVGGGGTTEAHARQELTQWVSEAEGLVRMLGQHRGRGAAQSTLSTSRTSRDSL